jgi:hypothetical protein
MDEWLSYSEAAERLNTTVEAVRLRALRGRWQKTIGNDKRPRIRLPEGWSNDVQTKVERRERKARNGDRTPFERTVDQALVTAFESHIKTLQTDNEALREQLAAAETRAEKQAAEFAERDAQRVADRARAEKQAAESAEQITRYVADLAAEKAMTEKAIAAFASLAERLDALATERARPWWRRLSG